MTVAVVPLSRELERGLEVLAGTQLATGEIPAHRRARAGNLEYCWMPLISAYVHDALAAFDSRSLWFDPQTREIVGQESRARFCRMAANIRRGIRGFLAWQQNSSGGWSRYGRESGDAPDADATSCMAAVLLDSPHRSSHTRLPWYQDCGGNSPPENPVARWNWLRYRALTAAAIPQPEPEWFLPAGGDCQPYAGLPMFFFALARALRHGRFDQRTQAAPIVVPALLALGREDGGFGGGPLSTALAIMALADLGYHGEALAKGASALRSQIHSSGLWPFEAFLTPACGSPSLSTAFAIAALARVGEADVEDHDF